MSDGSVMLDVPPQLADCENNAIVPSGSNSPSGQHDITTMRTRQAGLSSVSRGSSDAHFTVHGPRFDIDTWAGRPNVRDFMPAMDWGVSPGSAGQLRKRRWMLLGSGVLVRVDVWLCTESLLRMSRGIISPCSAYKCPNLVWP